MEDYPRDIFSLLGQNLTLNDIVSLALTNSRIRDILMSNEVNKQLALSLDFPYNLTFDELVRYNNMSLEDRLSNAVLTEDMRILKALIKDGKVNDFNKAAVAAASKGYYDILNVLLELGAGNYNGIALAAATNASSKEHYDIVNLMLGLGANNYGEIALVAAERGDRDLIIEMLNKNPVNVENLKRSIGQTLGYNGHYIPEFAENDDYYDGYIYGATEGNHIELVKRLIELREDLSVSYIAGLLDIVVILEKTEIANYLLELVEHKINNKQFDERDFPRIVEALNRALVGAAQKGYLDIVIRVIKLGADDYRRAFEAAEEHGHMEVTDEIRRLAVERGDIYKLI